MWYENVLLGIAIMLLSTTGCSFFLGFFKTNKKSNPFDVAELAFILCFFGFVYGFAYVCSGLGCFKSDGSKCSFISLIIVFLSFSFSFFVGMFLGAWPRAKKAGVSTMTYLYNKKVGESYPKENKKS
jgi:hypothetical protein